MLRLLLALFLFATPASLYAEALTCSSAFHVRESSVEYSIRSILDLVSSTRTNAALGSKSDQSAVLMTLKADPYLKEMRVTERDFRRLSFALRTWPPQSSNDVIEIFKKVFPAIAAGQKKLSLNQSRYDDEVPHTEVRDQDSFYSCWAMASACVMEMRQGHGVKLSHRFLYRNYMRSRLFEMLSENNARQISWQSDFDQVEGLNPELDPRNTLIEVGEFWKAIGLGNKFGMIPDHAWPQQKNFETAENRVLFLEAVKQIINRFRHGIDSRTQSIANLNAALDEFFGPVPSEQAMKQAISEELHPNEQVVRAVVDTSWDYRDEDYSSGTESMTIYDGKAEPSIMQVPVRLIKKPIDEVIHFIAKNIRASAEYPERQGNNAFFISFNFPAESPNVVMDSKRGEFDIIDDTLPVERMKLRHAVVVTGVEYDFYGRVIALKILNSYGSSIGKNGTFRMTDRFFKKLLFEVVYVGGEQEF